MAENFRMDSKSEEGRSYFIPLLLIAIALVIWTGFQTIQLFKERKYLSTVIADQAKTVDQSQKLRAQLDSIAKTTLQLAKQGNPNAKLIVEELRKRGVTINLGDSPAK
jgi:uncharacterized protein YoxC